MNCKQFVISLAEAYGKELTEPRAKIYKAVLEEKLGHEFPWRKLFGRVVCEVEIEYFPTIAKILQIAGYDERYEQLQLEKKENAKLQSVQQDQ